MIKPLVWTASITIVFVLLHSSLSQTKEYWLWTRGFALTAAFCRNQEIIVAGRLIDVQEAKGVKVFNAANFSFSGAKIYVIRVEEVLKGAGINPSEEISMLILPHVVLYGIGDKSQLSGMTKPQILEYYQQEEKLPPGMPEQRENYPEISVGELQLFGLFAADLIDPKGEMLWVGVEKLSTSRQLYGYSTSYKISSSGKEVEVIKRYLQIEGIADQDERLRQLAHYSLELLRDRDVSESVALGAIENLRGFHSSWAWGQVRQRLGNGQVIVGPARRLTAEYLSEAEINELVQMALDRTRSAYVRGRLLWVFKELNEYAHRPFEPEPFLRVLRDRTEDPEVRWDAVHVLEQLGGAVVRKAFCELLGQEPETESEQGLWDRLRRSRIWQEEKRGSEPCKGGTRGEAG